LGFNLSTFALRLTNAGAIGACTSPASLRNGLAVATSHLPLHSGVLHLRKIVKQRRACAQQERSDFHELVLFHSPSRTTRAKKKHIQWSGVSPKSPPRQPPYSSIGRHHIITAHLVPRDLQVFRVIAQSLSRSLFVQAAALL
jgi:hypothetical protein